MYFPSYNGCSSCQFSLPSHESYYQSHVRSILTRNGSSITKEYSMEEGENTSSGSQVPTNKRSIKLKKTSEIDWKNKAALQRQNSISCCSEDESINVPKSKANRGSATDTQSLYARKRRERINQRLRILQSLVPNGTKVDISTMLEEAVQYVKFLHLQIMLLSSDDQWMYAPIAYSGMDIGLDLKIGAPKS